MNAIEDVSFGVKVDTAQLERAIELANQLKEILKEVNQLINLTRTEMASKDTTYIPFESRP